MIAFGAVYNLGSGRDLTPAGEVARLQGTLDVFTSTTASPTGQSELFVVTGDDVDPYQEAVRPAMAHMPMNIAILKATFEAYVSKAEDLRGKKLPEALIFLVRSVQP